jgi:hypothetical protein
LKASPLTASAAVKAAYREEMDCRQRLQQVYALIEARQNALKEAHERLLKAIEKDLDGEGASSAAVKTVVAKKPVLPAQGASSHLERAEKALTPTVVEVVPTGVAEGKGEPVGRTEAKKATFTSEAKGKPKSAMRRASVSSRRSSVTSVASSKSAKSEASRKSKKGKSSRKAGKSESGIVGMSAAPSDYLGAGKEMSGTSGVVERYVEQLVNPWTGTKLQRVPDNNMRPTAIARFFANRTYTIPATGTYGTNFMFGMHSKMSNYASGAAIDQSSVIVSSSDPGYAGIFGVFPYTPGCIMRPVQFLDAGYDSSASGTASATHFIDGASHAGVWDDDFGAEESETAGWVAATRCIAMAMRCRVVGLPSGQFMTPGKLYFAQLRWNWDDFPLMEQDWTQLERLGYASHVSLDAVRESGSKTFFALPDGTDKFELSSTFLPAPGIFSSGNLTNGGALAQSSVRWFPPSIGTANSAFALPSQQTIPYNSSARESVYGVINDATDMVVADQTMALFMCVFGTQAGVVLEVDYASIHEYVATPAAPPGIDTEVQLPSSSAMDQIFASAAVIGEVRGAMLQAAGDKTILSAPTRAFGESRAALQSEGRKTKGALMTAVKRSVGGSISKTRGRQSEGFWDFDWLSKGSLGPINWDFSSGKKR